MLKVGRGHDECAATFRHLGAVDGEEAVGENCAGLTQSSARQHRGPEQTVEVDDVLTYEVVELSVVPGLPVALEIITGALTKVLMARNVPNRRVQPNIKIFVGVARNFETEIGRIPGYVPVLEPGVNPLAEFICNRRLQLFTGHPFSKQLLKRTEREK